MQSHRKLFLSLFAVLVILLMTVVIAERREQAQSKSVSKMNEAATPIQEGVMTERQKEHSKLYKEYKGIGKKLRDLPNREPNSNSLDIGIAVLPGLSFTIPPSKRAPNKNILEEMASGADAVIIGTVKNKASQLTENEMFIFTDYELEVEDILKDNTSAHIEFQNDIIVTRPGGKILLNGRTISAVDRNSKPLEVGGRYLIFLRYIQTTGAYEASSIKGAFRLIGNEIVALTDYPLPSELRSGRSALSFISEVRLAIEASKGKRGK